MSSRTDALRVCATLTLSAAAAIGVALPATASTADDPDRTAAVQTVLDRVLGPGGGLVNITDEVVSSTGSITSTTYGPAVPASVAANVTHLPGGRLRSWMQQNSVSSTTTTLSTPPGTLVRENVAVVVDRKRLGTTSVPTLKRLIGAAAGLTGSRGDRLFLLVTNLPPAPLARTPVTPFRAADYAIPTIYSAGGVAALLSLVVIFRRRGSRRSEVGAS